MWSQEKARAKRKNGLSDARAKQAASVSSFIQDFKNNYNISFDTTNSLTKLVSVNSYSRFTERTEILSLQEDEDEGSFFGLLAVVVSISISSVWVAISATVISISTSVISVSAAVISTIAVVSIGISISLSRPLADVMTGVSQTVSAIATVSKTVSMSVVSQTVSVSETVTVSVSVSVSQ